MSALYYVISLNHTKRTDNIITWWRPNSADYTFRIEEAGEYTEEEVANRTNYLNNGINTIAVPVDAIESLCVSVGQARSRSLDHRRASDDHVVPYSALAILKRKHGPRNNRKAQAPR